MKHKFGSRGYLIYCPNQKLRQLIQNEIIEQRQIRTEKDHIWREAIIQTLLRLLEESKK